MNVVTFSGFEENNPLKKEGQINFWANSKAYNIIECTHQIWLLMVCDLLFGKLNTLRDKFTINIS